MCTLADPVSPDMELAPGDVSLEYRNMTNDTAKIAAVGGALVATGVEEEFRLRQWREKAAAGIDGPREPGWAYRRQWS